jgi:hypothetical protein
MPVTILNTGIFQGGSGLGPASLATASVAAFGSLAAIAPSASLATSAAGQAFSAVANPAPAPAAAACTGTAQNAAGAGNPVIRGVPWYTNSGTTTSGATFTVPKDPGVAIGDLILVMVTWNGTGATPTITGFTAYQKATNAFGMAFFSRVADGTEGSTFTVTFTSGFNYAAVCVAYQNTNGLFDPTPTASGAIVLATTTIDAVSITSVADNDVLVWFGVVRSSGTGATVPTITVPSGLVPEGMQSNSNDASGANLGILLADGPGGTAGATGAMNGASSLSDDTGALLVAIQSSATVTVTSAQAGLATATATAAVNIPSNATNAPAGLATATATALAASTPSNSTVNASLATASASALQVTTIPRLMYDGEYSGGWTVLQATVPYPGVFSYGNAWTSTQIATLPAGTVLIPTDTTGSNPSTTRVLDVESKYVTSASICATWINTRNGYAGGYAVNRPTIYLNKSGSYYKGAADDVITPLANTYGLHLGTDYDLWIADTSGSMPSSPDVTNSVPAVATQYASYSQTGYDYDLDIIWDATWFPMGTTGI